MLEAPDRTGCPIRFRPVTYAASDISMQPMPLLRVTRQDRTPQTAPWAREIQIGARLAPPGLTEYMVVEVIVWALVFLVILLLVFLIVLRLRYIEVINGRVGLLEEAVQEVEKDIENKVEKEVVEVKIVKVLKVAEVGKVAKVVVGEVGSHMIQTSST